MFATLSKQNFNITLSDHHSTQSPLLLPGFATDARLLGLLQNTNFCNSPKCYNQDTLNELEQYCKSEVPDHIIGFSLGGFIALHLLKYLPSPPQSVTLIGIQQHYPIKKLQFIKSQVQENKNHFLSNFYRACFFNPKLFKVFQDQFLDDYLDTFSTEQLLNDLDLLGKLSCSTEQFAPISHWDGIQIIHGEEDAIAPISDVIHLTEQYPNISFKGLPNTGHFDMLLKVPGN